MRIVTAMDMRKRLGEILDAASAGERILIERDHRPLAYLVSVEEGDSLGESPDDLRARRLAALDLMDDFARRMAIQHPSQPGDKSSTEWIRWDRDHRDDPRGVERDQDDNDDA
jgi:prevent-host-death family protein